MNYTELLNPQNSAVIFIDSKVILDGMLANMCVESHLRDLLEPGFVVDVAKGRNVSFPASHSPI